jgi:hypothetical protein
MAGFKLSSITEIAPPVRRAIQSLKDHADSVFTTKEYSDTTFATKVYSDSTFATQTYSDTTFTTKASVAALVPKLYSADLSNGTAGTMTAWYSQNSVLVAPVALRMVVTAVGYGGFVAPATIIDQQVWDQSGANITLTATGLVKAHVTNQWVPMSLLGTKDYTAGQTCGFRLAYLTGSNAYLRYGITVSFYPL